MKCLSCGAQNSSQEEYFVCEYCGAENVRPEYFEDKSADALDSENLTPYKKQGIRSFNRKKFAEASHELDKYLTINTSDSEAWIFYALSEAELLKASNVDEKLLLISDALLSAKKNSKDKRKRVTSTGSDDEVDVDEEDMDNIRNLLTKIFPSKYINERAKSLTQTNKKNKC